MDESTQPIRRARFGPFEVDFSLRQLSKRGNRIKAHEQPLQVLEMLVARPGELVTREEIRQRLWPSGTFVDFDNGLNSAVNRLREVLGDSAEAPKYVETIPRYGYRFLVPVEKLNGLAPPASGTGTEIERQKPDIASLQPPAGSMADTQATSAPRWAAIGQWSSRHKYLLGAAAIVAVVVAGALPFSGRRTHALTDRDTIVLADFANSTGDAVFDETLKQGLSIQLAQSPFLNLLSDQKINETLKLMKRSPGDRLVGDVAREVCQRTGSKVYISGSIATLGSEYVLGLKATNCQSGETLAEEQVTAPAKEKVLRAVGEAASKLRGELGESLATVQKFDVSLADATTSSLDALKAYSLGREEAAKGDWTTGITFFKRAISLDPNFAMAYVALGTCYGALGESSLAAESSRKAYDLREHVSAYERLRIEAAYSESNGDLETARRVHEILTRTYPRNPGAHNNLGVIYNALGQHDKAIAEKLEALRFGGMSYAAGVISSYLFLNNLHDARSIANEALTKAPDQREALRSFLYQLAFLENDTAAMEEEASGSVGKPEEGDLLYFEAETEAYFGRLGKARELTRRAVDWAERSGYREVAGGYGIEGALREALFGNSLRVRQLTSAPLALSNASEVQFGAALALALTGDTARTQSLADDLARRFPVDTHVRFNFLPTLRAQVALHHADPAKALEALQPAIPYGLGFTGSAAFSPDMYPAYLRGETYLSANRGGEAALEFQKILDHPGVVLNGPIGALAHLQIGRAYALQGDTAKARAAYQDFLTLWKDADADIPILRAAKAEYAKLQ